MASAETVRQILRAAGVRWQATMTWKASRDPQFSEKMHRILEAVSLAAQRAEQAEIDGMQDLCDACAKADSADVEQLMEADEAFHTSLIEGARNPVMTRLYQTLERDIRNFRRRSYDGDGVHVRSCDEHQQIVSAIRRKESTLAAQLMLSHIWNLYVEVREQDPDAVQAEPISIFG